MTAQGDEDAYEMLEEQHERITGARMYSEYHSFRRGFLRWKKTLTGVSVRLILCSGKCKHHCLSLRYPTCRITAIL